MESGDKLDFAILANRLNYFYEQFLRYAALCSDREANEIEIKKIEDDVRKLFEELRDYDYDYEKQRGYFPEIDKWVDSLL